jgi:hypothetical protein
MTRRQAVTMLALLALAAPPAAEAQAPPVLGAWAGTAPRDAGGRTTRVAVRFTITALRVGRPAGTSQFRAAGTTCRGRLTLRARERGGYTFRDRRTSGPARRCTSGDRIFVRLAGDRLAVTIRPGGTSRRIRFTMGRA